MVKALPKFYLPSFKRIEIYYPTTSGTIGWLAIAVFAIAWDCFVIHKDWQSLSGAIWRSRKNPFWGPALKGLWCSVTWHLFFDNGDLSELQS